MTAAPGMPDDASSPIIPKQEEQFREESPSADSVGDVAAEGEVDGHISPPQSAPAQKREGGRKPVSIQERMLMS